MLLLLRHLLLQEGLETGWFQVLQPMDIQFQERLEEVEGRRYLELEEPLLQSLPRTLL